jgi:hypothetical protein
VETLSKPRTGSRRNVLKDQTKTNSPPATNGPDAETVLLFVGQYKKQMEKVAAEKKIAGKIKKLAINSGIVWKDLELVLKYAELEPETVLDNWTRQKKYAEFLGLPIGKQLALFEVPTSSIMSSSEMGPLAFNAGRALGIMGQNPDTQAYPVDNEHHQRHMEGWHEGQKILLDRIQPINIALDSEGKAADAREAGDDAMDEAA